MKLDVNGRTAYAYTGGKPFDPALPCVVFVHGALHDHSVWTLLARWFAHHGYGVLAVDLPGHGRSAGPPLPSVEATADWLLACWTPPACSRPARWSATAWAR
jgi:alpha-beta hydrolase superfamily lysophospholipase